MVQLAKTLCSQCRGLGSITCQGTIPYASTRKKILHAAIKDPACCSKEDPVQPINIFLTLKKIVFMEKIHES